MGLCILLGGMFNKVASSPLSPSPSFYSLLPPQFSPSWVSGLWGCICILLGGMFNKVASSSLSSPPFYSLPNSHQAGCLGCGVVYVFYWEECLTRLPPLLSPPPLLSTLSYLPGSHQAGCLDISCYVYIHSLFDLYVGVFVV